MKTKIRESVNFRLDPKLLKAARKKAEKDGTSLTALVVEGLNLVLGIKKSESSIENNIEIQYRLDDLTARVEKLESDAVKKPYRNREVTAPKR
jgi:predicted DNA binding CopG/RHH family protein